MAEGYFPRVLWSVESLPWEHCTKGAMESPRKERRQRTEPEGRGRERRGRIRRVRRRRRRGSGKGRERERERGRKDMRVEVKKGNVGVELIGPERRQRGGRRKKRIYDRERSKYTRKGRK